MLAPRIKLFSADRFLSIRGAMAEMTHHELDIFIMGKIMASCFQSSTLQGHHRTGPTGEIDYHITSVPPGSSVWQRTFVFLHKHRHQESEELPTNGPAEFMGIKGRGKHHLTLGCYILNYTGLKLTFQYTAECTVLYMYMHNRGKCSDPTWTNSWIQDPALQRNTKCGSSIRKLQVSSPCVLLATPPSQDCGGNCFLVL